jgi:hypothetical protein
VETRVLEEDFTGVREEERVDGVAGMVVVLFIGEKG